MKRKTTSLLASLLLPLSWCRCSTVFVAGSFLRCCWCCCLICRRLLEDCCCCCWLCCRRDPWVLWLPPGTSCACLEQFHHHHHHHLNRCYHYSCHHHNHHHHHHHHHLSAMRLHIHACDQNIFFILRNTALTLKLKRLMQFVGSLWFIEGRVDERMDWLQRWLISKWSINEVIDWRAH